MLPRKNRYFPDLNIQTVTFESFLTPTRMYSTNARYLKKKNGIISNVFYTHIMFFFLYYKFSICMNEVLSRENPFF